MVLSVIMNTGVVDNLFKLNENTYFILEDGNLNMQAIILKAILIAIIYFFVNNFISNN